MLEKSHKIDEKGKIKVSDGMIGYHVTRDRFSLQAKIERPIRLKLF